MSLCTYWILFIVFVILSPIVNGECDFPLVTTEHETYMDYSGCGLFCDMDDAATPWTDRVTNNYISIIFLVFLIPAFICNLIFTFNNINEHKENEETFATTPITYDALFVIDVAYLIVIICLILPHFSFFDGGNTVSSAYICNSKEATLSISNPIHGTNALCTLFGLLIFSGFKIILIYTGMLCVNIWYRLWKPMVIVGIKKKHIHGTACATVFIFDILLIAFGGIDANPSNGMCYIAMDDVSLLLVLDIVPNVLFIIISALCVANAAKQLKQELNVLQQAALVIDDLVNLIHRMVGFLIMAVLGSAFVVFTQIIWVIYGALWQDSTHEWIRCTQSKMMFNEWKYKYGDECIHELKDEGHSFPNEMFFIAFPIAALLSNIAIIVLTCHRRQSARWRRVTVRAADAFKRTVTVARNLSNTPSKTVTQKQPDVHLINSVSPPSAIQLKSPDVSTADDKPHLSVKVRHSPQNSQDVEQVGTVRYKASDDTQQDKDMTFEDEFDDVPVPGFEDNNTVIRKSTPDESENQIVKLDEETATLIELDKQKSLLARNKLEHISNASFDYHNSNNTRLSARSAPTLPTILGIAEVDTSTIEVTTEDMNKSKEVMGRIQTLELDDSERRDSHSQRSKTLPMIVKRSSTQKNFINFLDAALDDVKQRDLSKQPSSKTSTRTVRFVEVGDDTPVDTDIYEHDMNQKAADVMLRSTTDSIAMKLKNEESIKNNKKKRRELKKSKTSIDVGAIGLDIGNLTAEGSPSPDSTERRLSHKQDENEYAHQVTARQKRGFFDRLGRRKDEKDIKKLKVSKRSFRLRKEREFRTSTGIPLYNPSKLLKPLTMESQWNVDTSYFDEETDTDTMYSSPDTFSYMSDDPIDHLDVLLNHKEPTMQWQSGSNVFHFTLTDNDFKSLLHNTFTPHSTRNNKTMTFDADDPYADAAAGIIKEDEEIAASPVSVGTPKSKMGKGYTQSMDNIKNDQSVTAIGSDGIIVLSDIGRFKAAKSVPLISNEILNEDHEMDYDIKYDEDDLVQKTKTLKHYRTDTLHGQMLDSVPVAHRKGLSITIHKDFSCEVAEKRTHFKAETAKLAFTLKPVHSMKILM